MTKFSREGKYLMFAAPFIGIGLAFYIASTGHTTLTSYVNSLVSDKPAVVVKEPVKQYPIGTFEHEHKRTE